MFNSSCVCTCDKFSCIKKSCPVENCNCLYCPGCYYSKMIMCSFCSDIMCPLHIRKCSKCKNKICLECIKTHFSKECIENKKKKILNTVNNSEKANYCNKNNENFGTKVYVDADPIFYKHFKDLNTK